MNGQEMIQYDRTPGKLFQERAEEAIAGSARMGNANEWANVVAKGQGGDPEFGKNLVKKIKASQKKRADQTPTTKMFGNDWEVVKDRGHKSIAVEGTKGKKTIKEDEDYERASREVQYGINPHSEPEDMKNFQDTLYDKITGHGVENLDYCNEEGYLIEFEKDGKDGGIELCVEITYENWEPAEESSYDSPGYGGGLTELEFKIIGGKLIHDISDYNGNNGIELTPEMIKTIEEDKAIMNLIHKDLFEKKSKEEFDIDPDMGRSAYKQLKRNFPNNVRENTNKNKPQIKETINELNVGDKVVVPVASGGLGAPGFKEDKTGTIIKTHSNGDLSIKLDEPMRVRRMGSWMTQDIINVNNDDTWEIKKINNSVDENNKKEIKETMKRLRFKQEFNGVGNALKLIPETYKVNDKIFEMTDGNETYKIRWEGSLTEGKAVVLTAAYKKLVNEDIEKMKRLFNYKSHETLGLVKGKERLDENVKFNDIWNKTKELLKEDDEDKEKEKEVINPTNPYGLGDMDNTKTWFQENESTDDEDAPIKKRKDAYDASLDVADPEDMVQSVSTSDIEKSTSEPAIISKDASGGEDDDIDVPEFRDTDVKLMKSTKTGLPSLIVKSGGRITAIDVPEKYLELATKNPKLALLKIQDEKEAELEMSDEELMEELNKMIKK
jgi:hypothetical protein